MLLTELAGAAAAVAVAVSGAAVVGAVIAVLLLLLPLLLLLLLARCSECGSHTRSACHLKSVNCNYLLNYILPLLNASMGEGGGPTRVGSQTHVCVPDSKLNVALSRIRCPLDSFLCVCVLNLSILLNYICDDND